MRQVHCDGCGFTEADGLPKSKQKIQEVTLKIVNDPRFPEGTDKHVADLCPGCQGLLLHTYFKVPLSNKLELEVPTFLGPEELDDVASTQEQGRVPVR